MTSNLLSKVSQKMFLTQEVATQKNEGNPLLSQYNTVKLQGYQSIHLGSTSD